MDFSKCINRIFCGFLFFILFSGGIFAQRTLESTLLDGMTRKPVSGAHVYFDGTTIGTTTDSLGRFRISAGNVVNSSLVISHVIYEKIIIPDPFQEALPKIIYMEEEFSEISEVVISAKVKTDKQKRREMLDIFCNQLLGNDFAARKVKIANEDDIVLIHDKEQQTLSAYSKKPLEIVNSYLKYRIFWDLIEFRISYSDQTLDNKSVQNVSIRGTAFFMDTGNESKSLRTRRQDVFTSSARNVFYLLAHHQMKVDTLSQKPDDLSPFFVFEMYDSHIKLVNPDKYLIIKEAPHDPSTKLAIIRPEKKDSVTGNLSVYVIDRESLKLTTLEPITQKPVKEYGYRYYLNKFQKTIIPVPSRYYSKITFSADTFLIDAYGNTNLYDKMLIEHKLSGQRLSHLFPLNYKDIPLESFQAINDTPASEIELLSAPERIEAHFLRQIQSFPQEKIYVHTDKSGYLSGETVWFRAYLADYLTNSPASAESRYVYGELYNPVDSLIQRIKIRADSVGVFKGYFDLSPYLAGGNYRLRFYTRYMENAGEEYFFNRVISVVHPLSTPYHTDATFAFTENGSRIRAVLRLTQLKDGSPFVPQLLGMVNPSGKEFFISVNQQGEAGFDILPERDMCSNLLCIRCQYNNMQHEQYLAVPPSRSEYNVSFFPEGGALPAGVSVRVAFKALHSGGLGEMVTGKIYSSTGDTVAVFTSNPLGMGSFSFVPKQGEQYAAWCRNSSGVEKTFGLPAVSSRSMNLKVSQTEDRLMIQVIHAAGMILPDSMRLLVHSRGILYYNELWTAGKTISVRKDLFPSGVLQFLLLDKNLNPVSERLMFNLNEQDVAKVAVTTDRENYRSRELIHAGINLTSYDSIPLQGSFSVSVTADHQVKPDTTVNILSSLLLSSELKGYVETPAWYFSGANLAETDALLLTQGWSRYDIGSVLKGDVRTPENTPEMTPEISGEVVSGLFQQNKGEGWHVVMSVAGGNQISYDGTSAAVVNGRFRLPYSERPNGTSYVLQLIAPPNTLFRADMKLDTRVYPPPGIRLPYRYDTDRTDFETYRKNIVQPSASDEDLWSLYLSEVVISGAKAKGVHPLSPRRIQDRKITLNELNTLKKKAATLEDILRMEPGVYFKRADDKKFDVRSKTPDNIFDVIREQRNDRLESRYDVDPLFQTRVQSGGSARDFLITYKLDYSPVYWPYVIVTDGIWHHTYQHAAADGSDAIPPILSLPIDMLEEIEIIKAPAPLITLDGFMGLDVNNNCCEWDHRGNFGTILITTKLRNGGKKTGNTKYTVFPLGYQMNREFYSPVYETAEQQNEITPDLRSTIYWNPDVRTDEDGHAGTDFYTADTETTYTVVIEGVTDDGRIVYKRDKIEMLGENK